MFKKDLEALELKERIHYVAQQLEKVFFQASLGDEQKIANLKNFYLQKFFSLRPNLGIQSLALWPISNLVSDLSQVDRQRAFYWMLPLTECFTSEFAVRWILNCETKVTLDFLLSLTQSPNVHWRRFASEGSRPLLPWGERCPVILESPQLTSKILKALMKDPERYVQKSVANHLNDFSKHHPDYILKFLEPYKQSPHPSTQWIIKHALRTLVKKGNAKALSFFLGDNPIKFQIHGKILSKKRVSFGDIMTLEIQLSSPPSKKLPERIQGIIDYEIGYCTNRKSYVSYKTYKGKKLSIELSSRERLSGFTKTITLTHTFRNVTTRKFYSGPISVSVLVNGEKKELGFMNFYLN